MTKRTKKVGVTGKYGTRYVINRRESTAFPSRTAQSRIGIFSPRASTTIHHSAQWIGEDKKKGNEIADGSYLCSPDTVPPSENKSRRWKSPSTPNTSAHSAERQLSRDTRSESGIASLATRLSLEEHTLCRTSASRVPSDSLAGEFAHEKDRD